MVFEQYLFGCDDLAAKRMVARPAQRRSLGHGGKLADRPDVIGIGEAAIGSAAAHGDEMAATSREETRRDLEPAIGCDHHVECPLAQRLCQRFLEVRIADDPFDIVRERINMHPAAEHAHPKTALAHPFDHMRPGRTRTADDKCRFLPCPAISRLLKRLSLN